VSLEQRPKRRLGSPLQLVTPEAEPDLDDAALVRAFTQGEDWAAQAIWTRHVPMVYRLLERALGPNGEAEDLTQDVFLSTFAGLPDLREVAILRASRPARRQRAHGFRAEAHGRVQAEQRGLDAALAEVSSAELAALSDAARYSRREDIARRALAAQRRRFPRSARANDAAFLLGRLEETAQRPELALAWYERCLAESPSGTYVSEALGRKMTVVQRVQGAERARPVAQEYLRRFANGTYAAAARALLKAP
jgi:DNA-directed RNA polymerase specialized sigma24 family protein